jgi:hypothetical protein
MNKPNKAATRGAYLVDAYIAEYGGDGKHVLRDILADLMHFAAYDADYGTFDDAMLMATLHFETERADDEQA